MQLQFLSCQPNELTHPHQPTFSLLGRRDDRTPAPQHHPFAFADDSNDVHG